MDRLTLSLVLLLASQEGHELRSEEILRVLWSDSVAAKDKESNIRGAVQAIRQALSEPEGGFIVAARGCCSLDLGPRGSLDFDEFRQSRRSNDLAILTRCIELCGSTPFMEARFEQRLGSIGRRIQQDLLKDLRDAILRLSQLQMETNPEQVVQRLSHYPGLVEGDVDVAPDEFAMTLLVRAGLSTWQKGDLTYRSEILATYNNFAEWLKRALGAQPGHDLAVEVERLRAAGEPLTQPSDSSQSAPIAFPNLFVGRRREALVQELCRTLTLPNTRRLTLTGPPGVGKTRVAAEMGSRLSDLFSDGTFFISFATISDPDVVLRQMAKSLCQGHEPGHTIELVLSSFLKGKNLGLDLSLS
jgi:hypothetical protein